MSDDIFQLTATEASAQLARHSLHPSELVDACLARCDAVEPQVRAWAYLNPDQPAMAARLLDAADPTSPLYGIPFGVKDIIDTTDMPSGLGSPIYSGHQPTRDAACVALLREASAICFGKTVTTELAHFHPGKTRNPAAPGHTPGGSSSGSAAAVGGGMVAVALGTQTTGSVLRPASYCGVYGFKPSYGDVVRSGVFECATSFDTIGWFARCIEDIELMRLALLRAPSQPLRAAALDQLRIGVFRGPYWDEAEVAMRDAVLAAASRLEPHVAHVSEVPAGAGFADIAGHHRTIAGYEFARAISWERTQHGPLLSPKLLHGRCQDGIQASYESFAAAQAALVSQRTAHDDLMRGFDLLLTPAAPGEAWSGLLKTGDPVFNTAWTALHVPAISVPALRGPAGLPMGLQLVGRFRQDRQLLAAAAAVCEALGVGKVALPV